MSDAQKDFRDLLHAQRVWDVPLPRFDPSSAPAAPLPLFHAWFAEAVAAGVAAGSEAVTRPGARLRPPALDKPPTTDQTTTDHGGVG